MKLTRVSIKVPWLGSVELRVDETARRAAWALYVELVTRVSVVPLDLDEGLMREGLLSLHRLFALTRQVLREAGPDAGIAEDTVGGISIAVLNKGLRPFLTKWHPLLATWESTRPEGRSQAEHERAWPQEATLRGELDKLRAHLRQYADALAQIARVEI